ncbi:macrophage colony-stimulating factor 1b isoform X1 [Alosa sapidissima]|uniref:macrophage colony-stimulating factor 1b isoform X1 n=2 Tax=Alosa sapidissima TaxID=34773 RepID=UPI001C0A5070|nr:macrophage colony-stimulating factor 1b isoform X1 [Alosa sapidissima]
MTTTKLYQILHNAQVKTLCVLMLLCVNLAMGDVRGPCRHSLTKDHLLHIKSLINNQLQSGCFITYTFIERGSLSKVCYIKAALPWALELLSANFHYVSSSENGQNVRALKGLILNIYSQQCAPVINEEVEEDPVTFERVYHGSPKEALLRVQEVLTLYLDIITHSSTPVDWSCETEYAQQEPLPAPAYSPPSTEEPAIEKLGSNLRNETSQDLHNFYKLGFIAMTACCGILLPITVCCFIKHKKLQNNYHRTQIMAHERFNPYQHSIELQDLSGLPRLHA